MEGLKQKGTLETAPTARPQKRAEAADPEMASEAPRFHMSPTLSISINLKVDSRILQNLQSYQPNLIAWIKGLSLLLSFKMATLTEVATEVAIDHHLVKKKRLPASKIAKLAPGPS